jgi:hypothetical protein
VTIAPYTLKSVVSTPDVRFPAYVPTGTCRRNAKRATHFLDVSSLGP